MPREINPGHLASCHRLGELPQRTTELYKEVLA